MSMPSSSTDSDFSVRGKRTEGEKAKDLMQNLIQLKKRVQASRSSSIKEKLMKNGKTLEVYTCHLYMLATSKSDLSTMEQSRNKNVLTLRIGSTLCNFDGSYSGVLEKDIVNNQEELLSSGIVFGHSSKGKSLIRLIKLPFIEKMPPYTTWIFVDRNQRMAEDQSVVGRRQIYYDPCGSETLICSDSEEDIAEPEEEKHEFSEGEDHILWKALQEHGITQEVLKALCQFIDANTDEIQERYEILLRKHKGVTKNTAFPQLGEFERKNFYDRTLSMALDSFDNLFCRRCLIFDCRLHGCSQTLVTPNEKLPFFFEPTETMRPCSEQCYLRKKDVTESKTSLMLETESASLAQPSEEKELNSIGEQIPLSIPKRNYNDSGKAPEATENSELLSKGLGKRKELKNENVHIGTGITCAEKLPSSFDKKQKRLSASDPASVVGEGTGDRNLIDNKDLHEDRDAPHEYRIQHSSSAELLGSDSKTEKGFRNIEQDDNFNGIMENDANNAYAAPSVNSCESNREKISQDWNPFEKIFI